MPRKREFFRQNSLSNLLFKFPSFENLGRVRMTCIEWLFYKEANARMQREQKINKKRKNLKIKNIEILESVSNKQNNIRKTHMHKIHMSCLPVPSRSLCGSVLYFERIQSDNTCSRINSKLIKRWNKQRMILFY